MARHQQVDFSGSHCWTSLKRCYPTSTPCLSLGNENALLFYALEGMELSRFKRIQPYKLACMGIFGTF
jgi:hypothetical protein